MFETKLRCNRHDKQCESLFESGAVLEPLASFEMKLAALGAASRGREGWWWVTLTKAACAIRHNIASAITRDRELLFSLPSFLTLSALAQFDSQLDYVHIASVNSMDAQPQVRLGDVAGYGR